MTTEVQTQNQNTDVAEMSLNDWGETTITSNDIVVPKILAMQGLSKQVLDGKARFGDFIDSLNNEKIGDLNTPIEFIPFHLEKTWMISKKVGGNFKFEKTEACTPQNENRAFTETIGGIEYQNKLCMNFYVLRTQDMGLPIIISFRGMSLRAGRVLATQMFIKNRQLGLVPAGFKMKLFGRKTENDKGTFVTLSVEPVSKTDVKDVRIAYEWLKTIKSKPIKVHESPEEVVSEDSVSDDIPF